MVDRVSPVPSVGETTEHLRARTDTIFFLHFGTIVVTVLYRYPGAVAAR